MEEGRKLLTELRALTDSVVLELFYALLQDNEADLRNAARAGKRTATVKTRRLEPFERLALCRVAREEGCGILFEHGDFRCQVIWNLD